MRSRFSVSCAGAILVLFASGTMLAADGLAPLPFRNLRTFDPEIYSTITACYSHSLTCHRVIDEIESSSTIVYLLRGRCRSLQGGSCVRFAAASPVARWLHVVLDSNHRGQVLLSSTAHELQHVLEVVRAPQVVDVASFRSLYQRIGFFIHGSGMREEWETEEAQRIASVVSKEVKRSQRAALLALK